jgi:hypothetical protein
LGGITVSGVATITGKAFYDCKIKSCTLSGATRIEEYAFYNCTQLTSLPMPSGLTYIGDYAFQYCFGITSTSVTVPNGVTYIGNDVFSYPITSLSIPTTARHIGWLGVIDNADSFTLRLNGAYTWTVYPDEDQKAEFSTTKSISANPTKDQLTAWFEIMSKYNSNSGWDVTLLQCIWER